MNEQQAQLLIAKWAVRLGKGFHPDTPAHDYYNGHKQSLSDKWQHEYTHDMDDAFAVMGDGVYGFALRCIQAVDQ